MSLELPVVTSVGVCDLCVSLSCLSRQYGTQGQPQDLMREGCNFRVIVRVVTHIAEMTVLVMGIVVTPPPLALKVDVAEKQPQYQRRSAWTATAAVWRFVPYAVRTGFLALDR